MMLRLMHATVTPMVLMLWMCFGGTALAEPGPTTSTGTLIVLNKSESSASLLSLKTGKEFDRIPTGHGPHEVAVSPDGKTAVIGNYGTRRIAGSTLTVVDLLSRTVVRTIDLRGYVRPHGIVFRPKKNEVLVTAEQHQILLVVDIETGRIVRPIDTNQKLSHMVVVTPDGRKAFVTNIGSGSVSVVDPLHATLIKVIPTGDGAEGIALSPDGKQVWVANRAANTISVVDVPSLKVVALLDCPEFPLRIQFTPDGKQALVSNAKTGDVAVIDTTTHREVHRISMEAQAVETEGRLFGDRFGNSPVPAGIVIPPDGKFAYVANTNADMITVIDLKSWKIVNRLTAGKEPDGLGFTPLKLEDAGRAH